MIVRILRARVRAERAFVFRQRAPAKLEAARPIYFDGLEEFLVEFDIQHYVELEPG